MRRYALGLALTAGLTMILALGMTSPAPAVPASDTWQIRSISTPVQGRVPSFLSADGVFIAWTGVNVTNSRTYLYELPTGRNKEISASLTGSFYNPSLDGQTVVFQGGRPGAHDDIFAYEINNGLLTRITHNTAPGDSSDWNPRVDNGRVVWEKDMVGPGAKPGIYLYEMGMGTTRMILSGDVYRNPDIWGDYVVCVKTVVEGGRVSSQIILHNLITNETKPITDSTRDNDRPRISDGKIVWTSGHPWTPGSPNLRLTYQIMLYDIAAGTTTALTNNVAGNFNPYVEGDLVAWETKQPASVMVQDLGTGSLAQLPSQGDTVGAPDISGSTVIWFGGRGLYTAVGPEDATLFPDVPRDHPNFEAIEGMAGKQIISGYKSGYFGPDDRVIRQQFAKMIVLTMGFTVTEADRFEFADSAAIVRTQGELYPYHYVAKAALNGLTTGFEDGTFRPLADITRQQLITMVVRAGSKVMQFPPPGWSGALSYGDPTHGQNIRIAEYNGLLDGIRGPGGTLVGWNTAAQATRAECAQILWNLYLLLNPPAPAG